jgi:uncharacterized protein (UPF0332 family)
MSDGTIADIYLRKANESLLTSESEYVNGRYNSCASRAYYACFQAAIAALLREGIRPSGGQWAHTFVQAQFVGQLINRRHRYPAPLRSVLADLMLLRHRADYGPDLITQTEANRGLRRSRAFVDAVRPGGGARQ